MRALFARTLARDAADGVVFEADRFRVDPIQTATPHPGMRLFAVGRAGGDFGEISIDTTFDDADLARRGSSRSSPRRGEVPFWLCPPEMLVGRKLQVLAQLGPHRWRPKDLSDVWMILRGSPTRGVLAEAIERSFAGHDHAPIEDLMDRRASGPTPPPTCDGAASSANSRAASCPRVRPSSPRTSAAHSGRSPRQ